MVLYISLGNFNLRMHPEIEKDSLLKLLMKLDFNLYTRHSFLFVSNTLFFLLQHESHNSNILDVGSSFLPFLFLSLFL